MSRPPRDPPLGGRVARVLVTTLLLIAPVQVGRAAAAGPTSAAPARTPSAPAGSAASRGPAGPEDSGGTGADLPVTVTVEQLLPRAPRPGDAVQIVGSMRNEGPTAVRSVQLRLRVGDPLSTREQLRRADATPPFYSAKSSRDLPDLAPGGSAPIDLRLAVDDLQLGPDGVYPLQLEVRGTRGDDGPRAQVGAVPTYLPWFAGPVDPLRVAWLWPLVDAPRQGPGDELLDDGLATSLATGGRLERSLRASRSGEAGTCEPAVPPAVPQPAPRCDPVPVTYVVDPDLLGTAATMSSPYAVRDGAGTRPGTGSDAARRWLAGLSAATGAVVALPYADPDAVALTRNTADRRTVDSRSSESRSTADLSADLATARAYGDTVAADVLRRPLLGTVAVPPDGPVTDAALDTLTTSSTRAVVLTQSALADPVALSRSTPGTRVQLPPSSTSGPLTGLVVDQGLSALLTPDAARRHGPRLAEQRWVAETAMIAAELPNRGRTVLVAPPRRGEVDPDLLAPVLADAGRLPWLCPVTVADVAAAQERCPGGQQPGYEARRGAALRQVSDSTSQLDTGLVARTRQVRADSDQLTKDVLRGGTDTAQATRVRLQRGRLRAESSAWREDRSGGNRQLALLRQTVTDLRSKVSLLTGSVTLTSRNGRVSVAILNSLDSPVTVSVRLQAPTDARLSTTQTALLEVPPGALLPVDVNATTRTSGRFVVLAQLVDREGNDFGTPQQLRVRSTIYGTVALGVTGGAAAVLLLAAGARLLRRAVRR